MWLFTLKSCDSAKLQKPDFLKKKQVKDFSWDYRPINKRVDSHPALEENSP